MHTVLNTASLFKIMYSNIDGYDISKKARAKLSYRYYGHVYGEITHKSFEMMLKHIGKKENAVFYDLGSGIGKAVMLASLLGNFSKVVGVEILQDLHETSLEVLKYYRQTIIDRIIRHKQKQTIEFIRGDFKDIDFSDADVIFINATCFSYEFNGAFFRKIINLKKGTRIINTTLNLNFDSYKSESIGSLPFSWGHEPTFLHTKVA